MITPFLLSTSAWVPDGSAALGVIAVALGIWQIRRSGNRNIAAARQWLQLRAPEMEATERHISQEVAAGNRDGAAAGLRDWRRIAPEFQALLKSAGISDDELEAHLEQSLELMNHTLEELGDTHVTPNDACRRILRHIRDACAHSRRIATDMR